MNGGCVRPPRCASPPFWDDSVKWKSALQESLKDTEAAPFWPSCPRSMAELGLLRTHLGGNCPTRVNVTLRSSATAFPAARQRPAAATMD